MTQPSMPVMPTIGFLGPGEMGGPMVQRLLANGYPVIVWERTRGKHQRLSSAGATLAPSISETVRRCDVVIGCLRDTNVTRETYLGGDGVINALREGQAVVEHGTFDPTLAVDISRAAQRRGCEFLDAPVTGGPEGAQRGELVIMAGGDPLALEHVRAPIASYSKALLRVGPVGSGQRLKLINQLLVTIHTVAAAEASALVMRAGIDPSVAEHVLTNGWAASAMLSREMPRALTGDFRNSGATVGKLRDVQPLIAALLAESRVDSTLFEPAREMFDRTAEAGGADLDLASIVREYL